MTSLERALASILESIEDARTEKDALALAGLLQRKDSICAALAAPEFWHDARERGSPRSCCRRSRQECRCPWLPDRRKAQAASSHRRRLTLRGPTMRNSSVAGANAPLSGRDGKVATAERRREPDPLRRHDCHRRLRRHRLCRGDRGRPGGALSRQRQFRRRRAARSEPRLRRGPGRRQGARAQPPRPSRARQARDRRALGPGAEAAGAGGLGRDRGLQPAAGRHHPPLPRHRRRQARSRHPHRARHLRRSAPRRRQAQWPHQRRPRRADAGRWGGVPLLPRVPDQRRHRARHHRRSRRQHHHGARGAHP